MNDKILTFEEYTMNDDFSSKHRIDEMATISRNEKFGKDNYRVSIHGPASADRENPHIHIYCSLSL